MKIQIKKQISVLSSIALMGMLFFISGCSHDTEVVKPDAEVENDTGQVEFVDNLPKPISDYSREEVLKEVLPILKKFIDSQFSYAMGKDKEPQWNNFLLDPDLKLKKIIDNAVIEDAKLLGNILMYSGELKESEHTTIFFSGGNWVIENILSQDKIEIGDETDSFITEGGWNYSFSIKKDDNNQWKIIDWRDDNNITESPRWYRSNLSKQQKIFKRRVNTRSSSYYAYKAKNYALAHWNNPNTNKWCDYSANGGDCTNFVSQCLIAGGWNQKKGASYCSNSVWFHKGAGHMWNNPSQGIYNYSCSWTQANDFYNYLQQVSNVNVTWLGNLSILPRVGDIVSKKTGSRATHTMIVTGIRNGVALVTFRNGGGYPYNPRKNLPLSVYNQELLYYWSINGGNGLLA